MDGGSGFEPEMPEPKPGVLPLNYPPADTMYTKNPLTMEKRKGTFRVYRR